jgi:TatD DNase family protein
MTKTKTEWEELKSNSQLFNASTDKCPFTFVETHCHIDYLKSINAETLAELSTKFGIDKMITISVSPENVNEAFTLAQSFPKIFCTQGIHPHDARLASQDVWTQIRQNYRTDRSQIRPKIVAIGEIGLDYHYNKSPVEIQKNVFEEQLSLAIELNLPCVIHTRDADEDTLAILNNFPKLKGAVLHSYTSGMALAEWALSRNFYLGFNGIITFKNAENVREVLNLVPLNQLLLETDSPFLSPIPFRGSENNPLRIPWIALKISELKNESLEKIASETTKNAHQLFDFSLGA